MIGKTLGHYEITSQLGKGGMGEVYQAKDQKLGRDVAIKVLPEEFAKDTERVARFQREAKLLASLNHPNIAAIHGLEESGGTNFLVLELVEGETLADQLKRGPIPVEEALKLALQIAEALEAAHEKGVIHRDLKPANIKVTPDGKVKVLDFGLAKAFAGDQEALNLSNSPTLSNAATQQGVILGTAAYMSPEQARGKSVDKRTDIWAFGAVLFEMLTGQAAFQGEDITEILASVVKGGANLDLLPANLHFRVREVIIRCLQKDLRRRYPSITDARYEIEQALADPSGVLVQPQAATEQPSKWKLVLPWASIAAVLSLIIGGLAVWQYKPTEPPQVMHSEYDPPKDQQLGDRTLTLAISPDGKQFVYSTPKGLYVRPLNEFDAKLIIGTETVPTNPFFSPNGKWVGYFSQANNKLKKIAISGGAPVTLCNASMVVGASWGADDRIVYADYPKGIARVSANGGTPEIIARGLLAFPQLLPDGKSLLFTSSPQPYKIVVQSLQSGERKELFAGNSARYILTGHIIYGEGSNLLAVAFDLKTLKVTGGSVPVVEGVWQAEEAFTPQYAVSDSGMLVYMPGTTGATAQRALVWIDRKGKEVPIAATPNSYSGSIISPDGTKVALTITSSSPKSDIWIYDFVHETMTRLTFNETSFAPNWTPDGKRIVFVSGSTAIKWAVYWKAADGTGGDEILIPEKDQGGFLPCSWSRDGKTLLLSSENGTGTKAAGIVALPLEGDRKLKTLLQEKFAELSPNISSDGRWMAYVSYESGKGEIYVRPFPDVNNGKWQISSGADPIPPLWSPNGRELFYVNGDSIMAVAVEAGQTFKCGKPEKIFQGKYIYDWSISHDGNRFLVMKEVGSNASAEGGPRKINIVLNWFEELKQRVP